MVEYIVIDDYGDEWEHGSIAYTSRSLIECIEWKEAENYHSASVVKVIDGERVKRVD